MRYALVIYQGELQPAAEVYLGDDRATLEAAGARRCKELNAELTGETLAYSAVVSPTRALPPV